jgi:XapX domain-containing protein
MKEIVLSLIGGIVIGALFKICRLPLPAPPVLAGVLGIVGIYLGGVIIEWIFQYLKIIKS